MRLLLKGGIVLENPRQPARPADVAVSGDRIVSVGSAESLDQHGPYDKTIDCRGHVVLPGFVNAHTHTFQTLFRGLGEGLPFPRWQREVVYPLYEVLTADVAALFSLVGCIENIRSGVTSLITFQAYPNDEEACADGVNALIKSGLRSIFVKGVFGENAPPALLRPRSQVMRECESVLKSAERVTDRRVRVWIGPPMLTRVPLDWVRDLAEMARAHGSGLHVHVGETRETVEENRSRLGMSEIAALARIGALDERFHAAHCVWLSDEDMELLHQARAHVMHCPVSNLYLGYGIAPVVAMTHRGLNVCLGSDGPASNDNQDMFTVIKMASLLQKGLHCDATLLPSTEVLEWATVHGAKAFGMTDVGLVVPGMQADLIVVDLCTAQTVAAHRAAGTLVYSSLASSVDTVIAGGKIVMENRKLTTLDEAAILEEAQSKAEALLRKAGLSHLRESWSLDFTRMSQ